MALVVACASAPGGAAEVIEVGRFSKAQPGSGLPPGWQLQTLPNIARHTRYSLVEVDGRTVLEADAHAAFAALALPLRADPHRTPWLEWSWRVDNVVQKGDIRTKEGDDYAARVYVVFDYDVSKLTFGERAKIRMAHALYGTELPIASLCYVWDNRQPVGFTSWSAYTDRLRMIVATSGSPQRLVRVSRNVVDDFRAAFGEEPPAIKAIVVASDTDNTGESVRAHFGDIQLRRTPSE